ncbi:MAG: protein kinase [Anaerolineales bacterium]|nr:protein kinase [Anaerolineales bacterium]
MGNPYISRGPVRSEEMFFGRIHELAEIRSFVQGNQSISIVGPRKIGKTSLLYHLMQTHRQPAADGEKKLLYVYIDCEVLGDASHNEIFGQLAAEISEALVNANLSQPAALDQAILHPTRLSFEAAVRALNKDNLRIVLIMDEFERLSRNPLLNINFFNALRSAAGRYRLVFITASAKPLIQLTFSDRSEEILSSPFFNIFAQLFLSFFPDNEAFDLIHIPAHEAGVNFSNETRDFIFDLVGGNPFALQVACYHAFETGSDNEEIENRTKRELEAHFEYFWRGLSMVERDTLIRLPEINVQKVRDSTLPGVFRNLSRSCLVIEKDEGYEYSSRAWGDYIEVVAAASNEFNGEASMSGRMIAPYRIEGLLKRGGMSEVYKGRHINLNRQVAIKILSPQLASDNNFRLRFEREAQSAAALKHPNIVQIFDFGETEDVYYLVMEYIDGRDLKEYIQEHGAFHFTDVKGIIKDTAQALDYAHSRGLVHRDVKPSNILLQPISSDLSASPFRAILADFGLTKIMAGATLATNPNTVLGSLNYMAPEQIEKPDAVDRSTDIYGLGTVVFELMTGQVPFVRPTAGSIMMAHIMDPVPDPRSLNDAVSNAVAEAIMQALSKDPNDRHETAAQFYEALNASS